MIKRLRMPWLFNKQFAWIFMLVIVAMLINMVGIQITGDVEQWSAWLKAHAAIFLGWRLILYAFIGYGWYWTRQRIMAREANTEAKLRFIRVEVSAVCVLVVLELSNWFA